MSVGSALMSFWPRRAACGISVPRPGIEPGPRQWKPRILTTRPPGNSFVLLFFFFLIYFFLAVLGLCFCARAFSSCGMRGATLHRGAWASHYCGLSLRRLQTRRLSSCGSRAQLLRGMWDLPRPGLEPASLALAGRLSTTAPPGKPCPPSWPTVFTCFWATHFLRFFPL